MRRWRAIRHRWRPTFKLRMEPMPERVPPPTRGGGEGPQLRQSLVVTPAPVGREENPVLSLDHTEVEEGVPSAMQLGYGHDAELEHAPADIPVPRLFCGFCCGFIACSREVNQSTRLWSDEEGPCSECCANTSTCGIFETKVSCCSRMQPWEPFVLIDECGYVALADTMKGTVDSCGQTSCLCCSCEWVTPCQKDSSTAPHAVCGNLCRCCFCAETSSFPPKRLDRVSTVPPSLLPYYPTTTNVLLLWTASSGKTFFFIRCLDVKCAMRRELTRGPGCSALLGDGQGVLAFCGLSLAPKQGFCVKIRADDCPLLLLLSHALIGGDISLPPEPRTPPIYSSCCCPSVLITVCLSAAVPCCAVLCCVAGAQRVRTRFSSTLRSTSLKASSTRRCHPWTWRDDATTSVYKSKVSNASLE